MKSSLAKTLSRRQFLGLSGAAVGLAQLPNTTLYDTTFALERSEYTVQVAELPRAFEGYRIGFLSDIHLGANMPPDFVSSAFSGLLSERIDLLIIGGDVLAVSNSAIGDLTSRGRNPELHAAEKRDHPAIIFRQLYALLSGVTVRDGIFAVFGNHEWWVAPQLFERAMPAMGVTVLRNQHHRITRGEESLTIYGVDDYWNGTPLHPRFTTRTGSAREARVLVSHNPDYVALLDEAGRSGRVQCDFDLALCGHTHGGQIRLPIVGALSYNIRHAELGSGMSVLQSGRSVFTSRGVGVVEIPYRLNCPPEITVLELRRQ